MAFLVEREYAPVLPPELFDVSPFGEKMVNGQMFDFDAFHKQVLAPRLESSLQLTVRRADEPFWDTGLWSTIKAGIERASVVMVDFSGRSGNVGCEYVAARYLGKRILIITQNPTDIPSDLQGERYLVYPSDMTVIKVNQFLDDLVAQLRAMLNEPVEELEPRPMTGYSSSEISGTIVNVTKDVAVIKLDDGEFAVLGGHDIDWTRTYPDVTKRLTVGARLDGRRVHDPKTNTTRFTLLNYQAGNPWVTVQQTMTPGQVLEQMSVLRVSPGVGAFVKVHGEINGLIRESGMRGARVQPGDKVDVVITSIRAEERKISLELRSVSRAAMTGQSTTTGPTSSRSSRRQPEVQVALPLVGFSEWGEVKHVAPGGPGKAGYILLQLPGYERCVMLLAKNMSSEMRSDFEAGDIQAAEEEMVYVRVTHVEPSRGRVLVEDAEPPADLAVTVIEGGEGHRAA